MSATRVLVVDDEPGVLLTLAANLELEGFDVVTAENGAQALEVVRKQELDLVFSDIRMPGISGIDLFREIKKIRPELPMILTTAFFLEEQIKEVVGEGVFAVLPKPAEIDDVVKLLQRAHKRPWVLVVDDAEPHAVTLAEALRSSGLRARAVFSGRGAIDEIKKGDVDVCVTDVVMPEIDGARVVEEVRRLDPTISIIVFSGHAVGEIMARVAAGGVEACLRKPIAVLDLVQIISRARSHAVRRR